MSVLIGINVKDSAVWLPRFLSQVDNLGGDIKRIVFIYGASTDATYSIIDHWRGMTKHRVEVYSEPYLPLEERSGASTLARAERDMQTLLKNGDEEYYLKLDADLVEIHPSLLWKLIDDNVDVVAPYVWTEGREQRTFFDIYGFRKDGCRYHPLDPPMGKDKMPIDTVGTCFLAERDAALEGIYQNPYPLIQFCISLKAKGFQVYADPRVNVTHVDLEKYGVYHNPLPITLSNAKYIKNGGEQIFPQNLDVEVYYNNIDGYNLWLKKNKPASLEHIQKFNESRPLITASYKVLNEGKFIGYSLASVYPYVDRIDIIEGATKEAIALGQANPDGSSIDDTIEVIKAFPDPDKKIRLIRGVWKEREQVQAKLLEICTSRWMLFIDGDEIVENGASLRRFCQEHLDGNIVHAKPNRFYTFWHDFHHIVYSLSPLSPWAKQGIPHAFLIWRDIPGLNFSASHTIAMDAHGVSVSTAYLNLTKYDTHIKTLDDVYVYHFGSAKGKEAMDYKLKQVHPRLLGEGEDPWLSGVMPVDMVMEEFTQELPSLLRVHPERDKMRIRITETKPSYRFEVLPDAYS